MEGSFPTRQPPDPAGAVEPELQAVLQPGSALLQMLLAAQLAVSLPVADAAAAAGAAAANAVPAAPEDGTIAGLKVSQCGSWQPEAGSSIAKIMVYPASCTCSRASLMPSL